MKVVILATVLCLAIILPLNLSARCWNWDEGGDRSTENCNVNTYNLTNYERTTLANIPALNDVGDNLDPRPGILGRLYGIVFCFWVICFYACTILRREWIEMVALRRVYYLEFNHWRERKHELHNTLLKDLEDGERYSDDDMSGDHEKIKKVPKKEDDPLKNRDPWIPHPEQRETVPNIALYSVLVGGLPAAPQDEINNDDVEAAVFASRRQNIDWQLTFAGEYLDRCVPNQPGYSSSIAAITILPSAPDLAHAWSKWYNAAAKLRRLRHVRYLIRNCVHYDILDDYDDHEKGDDRKFELPGAMREVPRNQSFGQKAEALMEAYTVNRRPSIGQESQHAPRQIYQSSAENKVYYRDVLGSSFDGDVDQNNLFMSFEFGPEQTAVYSREFAQSAAACCPHGCFEGRMRRLGIDGLRRLEEQAKEEVHTANLLLRQAQKHAIVSEADAEHASSAHKRSKMREEQQIERVKSYRSFHLPSSAPDRQMPTPAKERPVRHKSKVGATNRTSKEWTLVDSMVNNKGNDSFFDRLKKKRGDNKADTGVVKFSSMDEYFGWSKGHAHSSAEVEVNHGIAASQLIDLSLVRESTYAVVTFTSRQAACAARQCLADGRGLDRWMTFEEIPVPPLADAAPFALCPCRGCCRPVTISINDQQKSLRLQFSHMLLACIYFGYTIPLTFAASLVDPSKLDELIPGYEAWVSRNVWSENIFSGILPALIWTLFFAMCPVIFKTIANFGSNAHSVYKAEFKAMQYYWWFIVLTAFTGSSLSNMVLQGFNAGIRLGSEATQVLATTAATIPTLISATWLNWIIVRMTITLPLNYLVGINSFIFQALGWKCCSRIQRGGGPGGPVPYRTYIDSGVVFLCSVALGPAAPLLTAFALLYFLFCWPLMRRNLIFVYRPSYDAGGGHWPFLFEILMSSLFTAVILLTTMMALKKAFVPAIFASLPFIPMIFFRMNIHRRFLKPFLDTSLYTSSSLDGWDIDIPTCVERREEFRRFLVDAHKAAYVPVCLASSAEVLTAEPAIVISSENDKDLAPVVAIPKQKAKSKRPPSHSKSFESTASNGSEFHDDTVYDASSVSASRGYLKPARSIVRKSSNDNSNHSSDSILFGEVPQAPQAALHSGIKARKSVLKGSTSIGPLAEPSRDTKSRAASKGRTSRAASMPLSIEPPSKRVSVGSANSAQHMGSLRLGSQGESQYGVSLRRIAPHYQNQISVNDDGSVSSRFRAPLTPQHLNKGLISSQSFESSDDEFDFE
jgi:hypothetical protein